jgi:hypothetical protein
MRGLHADLQSVQQTRLSEANTHQRVQEADWAKPLGQYKSISIYLPIVCVYLRTFSAAVVCVVPHHATATAYIDKRWLILV